MKTGDLVKYGEKEGIILACSKNLYYVLFNDDTSAYLREEEMERKVYVRELNMLDLEEVLKLDALSGNNLSQELDAEEYCWGIFVDNKLVGYCSLGGTDGTYSEIEDDISSFFLSDVFILEEYRKRGHGSFLINDVTAGKKVYLMPSDLEVEKFYEKNGFEHFGNSDLMYKE